MSFLTKIPLILGVGLNIWLGLLLIILVFIQVGSGLSIYYKGERSLIPYHRFNAGLILVAMFIHVYYGIGATFLKF